MFENKRVLITGGTGSFGQAMTHRLLNLGVREIRIFSRGEKKQWDMSRSLSGESRVAYIIGDIRASSSLLDALQNIDIVFHAAALKYVPLGEHNVLEVVRTNVIGTDNLIRTARESHVDVVVALSTDKAVMPVNVYGMTKALMERLLVSANVDRGSAKTRYITVRYGNVIGSSGSVVPLFKKQIESGGPVTITDVRMTRFWFTLGDAVDLALNAANVGVGGEIFVRKIPAAGIVTLAQALIGPRDISIEEIGIWPGEKTHELLISKDEVLRVTKVTHGYAILPVVPMEHITAFYGEPEGIADEYSSRDGLMSVSELSVLLARADWLR